VIYRPRNRSQTDRRTDGRTDGRHNGFSTLHANNRLSIDCGDAYPSCQQSIVNRLRWCIVWCILTYIQTHDLQNLYWSFNHLLTTRLWKYASACPRSFRKFVENFRGAFEAKMKLKLFFQKKSEKWLMAKLKFSASSQLFMPPHVFNACDDHLQLSKISMKSMDYLSKFSSAAEIRPISLIRINYFSSIS
jgi:hypothetical protein